VADLTVPLITTDRVSALSEAVALQRQIPLSLQLGLLFGTRSMKVQ
jgi:hypothetical protein